MGDKIRGGVSTRPGLGRAFPNARQEKPRDAARAALAPPRLGPRHASLSLAQADRRFKFQLVLEKQARSLVPGATVRAANFV
jgi:hypothetical protein